MEASDTYLWQNVAQSSACRRHKLSCCPAFQNTDLCSAFKI